MAYFRWKGMAHDGSSRSGKRTAPSISALQQSLSADNIALFEAHPTTSWTALFSYNQKIPKDSIPLFFEQLSVLLSSGVDLISALRACQRHSDNTPLGAMVQSTIDQVEKGISLHEALHRYERQLPALTIPSITVGEASGSLATVCSALAQQINDKIILNAKIRSALATPLVTLGFAVTVVLGIILFIIPQLEPLLAQSAKPLPASTKTLIFLSHLLTNSTTSLPVMIGFGSLIALFWFLLKQYARGAIDACLFSIPFIGTLEKKRATTNLFHHLHLFLKNGIPLVQALEIIHAATTNKKMQMIIHSLIADLQTGKTLEAALLKYPSFFSSHIITLIHAGTQSGTLADAINKALILLNRDIDTKLNRVTTLINPIMTILVGIIIFILIVSIYLPLFSLAAIPRW